MQIYTFAAEKSNLFFNVQRNKIKKRFKHSIYWVMLTRYTPLQSQVIKYVVKPTDFHSLSPKLCVKVGYKVKAGTSTFF